MNKEKINKTYNEDELKKEVKDSDNEVKDNEAGKEVLKKVHKDIDIDDNSLDVYADEESNGIGYEIKV